MIYISFFVLLLQLLLFCSISVAFSLVVKNEIVSILTSILLLYGLENIVSSGVTYWTSTGRYKIIFAFFGLSTHGELPPGFMFIPTVGDVTVAMAIPLILYIVLVAICLVYYIRILEIDYMEKLQELVS